MLWWQVDEDGESSDDESHAIAPVLNLNDGSQRTSSARNEPHDAIPSTTPPISMTVLDLSEAGSRSNGSEMRPGSEEQEAAVPHTHGRRAEGSGAGLIASRATAASEGTRNGSSLRQGPRVRKRVAALWSKLRAIAYIASLQVGGR